VFIAQAHFQLMAQEIAKGQHGNQNPLFFPRQLNGNHRRVGVYARIRASEAGAFRVRPVSNI
jgi:hypothetical protein